MKLRSDIPRAKRLAAAMADMVNDEGDTTSVNGHHTLPDGSLLKADWAEAAANRVQMFVQEFGWAEPLYEVNFAGRTVLDAPFSLANGAEMLWEAMGWKGVCRRLSPDTSGDEVISVTALVELTTRK